MRKHGYDSLTDSPSFQTHLPATIFLNELVWVILKQFFVCVCTDIALYFSNKFGGNVVG